MKLSKSDAAYEALKKDPFRAPAEIAAEVGCDPSTVRKARSRLTTLPIRLEKPGRRPLPAPPQSNGAARDRPLPPPPRSESGGQRTWVVLGGPLVMIIGFVSIVLTGQGIAEILDSAWVSVLISAGIFLTVVIANGFQTPDKWDAWDTIAIAAGVISGGFAVANLMADRHESNAAYYGARDAMALRQQYQAEIMQSRAKFGDVGDLKALQRKLKVKDDGIFGQQTRGALEARLGAMNSAAESSQRELEKLAKESHAAGRNMLSHPVWGVVMIVSLAGLLEVVSAFLPRKIVEYGGSVKSFIGWAVAGIVLACGLVLAGQDQLQWLRWLA